MSKLKEYREMENALQWHLERLEVLKNSAELVKELEFEKNLITLLDRYSKKMEDLIAFARPPAHWSEWHTREKRSTYRARTRKPAKQ